MPKTVMLHEMTRTALERHLQEEPEGVVILAIGSIEQHGPHLPLGTDTMTACELAKRAAERTNSLVVVPCWPGYSPHHMGFTGTVTFRTETMLNVLMDTIGSLSRHGMNKVLIFNGHGGNDQLVTYVTQLAKREHGAVVMEPKLFGMTAEGAPRFLKDMDVHSGKYETAFTLCLFPELVDMDQVKDFAPTVSLAASVDALRSDPEGPDSDLRAQILMAHMPDTHEFTSSGIYGFSDPNDADTGEAAGEVERIVDYMVRLIDLWKKVRVSE